MAHKIQAALRAAAPLLILDEDRSATNLLVPGCLQSGEVTPLDILIAQADRILVLAGHEAQVLEPGEFRRRLDRHLAEVRKHLAKKDRSS
jgi:hypothetical protein